MNEWQGNILSVIKFLFIESILVKGQKIQIQRIGIDCHVNKIRFSEIKIKYSCELYLRRLVMRESTQPELR